MKTQRLSLAILVLGATGGLLQAQPASNAPPCTALYVFGDSWSVTAGGPYWNGHCANGPMWPEILSTNWGLRYVEANNYTRFFNGGTTSDVLDNQLAHFAGSSNAATSLFVVWAVGNDVGAYLWPDGTFSPRALTNTLGWSNLSVRINRNHSNIVVRLHRKGARTIMLADLDDTQRLPLCPQLDDTQAAQLSEQTHAINRALANTWAALGSSIPNLRILRFNFHDRWNEFLDQAVSLGFTRVDVGVLDDAALKDKSYTGPGSNYVFWDGSHTTSRVHAFWAQWIDKVATQTRTESLRLVARGDGFDLGLTRLKPGRHYTLETSHDLTSWTAQESFTAVEGTNTVTIAPSSSAPTMRLFRVAW
jgi:phospholipase/lecithinase/hemolysin